MGVCEEKPKYKNINESQKRSEIALKSNREVNKSLCKVRTKNGYITGFFMKISDFKKYLIINSDFSSQGEINERIVIEIYNKESIELNLNNRYIKYFKKPIDITIIEIKNTDIRFNDMNFLYYINDKNDYNNYKDKEILIFSYEIVQKGKIIKIDDFKFDLDISLRKDSYGCPIFLLSNYMNLIGIQKETGIFIGEIFNYKAPDSFNNYKNYNKQEINNNESNIRIVNIESMGGYIPYSCILDLEKYEQIFQSQINEK